MGLYGLPGSPADLLSPLGVGEQALHRFHRLRLIVESDEVRAVLEHAHEVRDSVHDTREPEGHKLEAPSRGVLETGPVEADPGIVIDRLGIVIGWAKLIMNLEIQCPESVDQTSPVLVLKPEQGHVVAALGPVERAGRMTDWAVG